MFSVELPLCWKKSYRAIGANITFPLLCLSLNSFYCRRRKNTVRVCGSRLACAGFGSNWWTISVVHRQQENSQTGGNKSRLEFPTKRYALDSGLPQSRTKFSSHFAEDNFSTGIIYLKLRIVSRILQWKYWEMSLSHKRNQSHWQFFRSVCILRNPRLWLIKQKCLRTFCIVWNKAGED